MNKYKNRLPALVNPKTSFKNKRKLLIQRGGFIVQSPTSIFSSVIGAIINNSTLKMALKRMILFPPELWKNRSQAPQPPPQPVKSY